MKPYSRITFWESTRRILFLFEFRNQVVEYFNAKPESWSLRDEHDSEESARIRSELNSKLDEANAIVTASGIHPVLHWSPSPMIGGYSKNIDLIINLFNLTYYQIKPTLIIDFIERATGVYQSNHIKAVLRTFNPLFWLDCILTWIARSPFNLLRRAGFNADKIEDSFIGRIAKLVTYLFSLVISILTILQMTGHLEAFLRLLKIKR